MKKIAILVCAACMSCTALYAQNRAQTAKPADRMEKCTKVANRLADKLQLDDRTQQWFVPLYAAYQDTLMGIRRTYRCMGKQVCQQPGRGQGKKPGVCALNDAEAQQCVENALKRDELTLQVKRDYYAQFKKQLTPQQLVRIFCAQQRKPNQGKRTAKGLRGQGHHRQGHGVGWQGQGHHRQGQGQHRQGQGGGWQTAPDVD